MKKIVALVLLCLLILPYLVSCSFVGNIPINKNSEVETDENGVIIRSKSLSDFIGIWYSSDAALTLNITSNGIEAYIMSPLLYEYTSVSQVEYSISGETLSFTVDGSDLAVAINNGEMSLSDGSAYFDEQPSLPTEHPTYSFPDFDAKSVFVTAQSGVAEKILAEKKIATYQCLITAFDEIYEDYETLPLSSKVIEEGDYVNINYSGILDGETQPFSGGTGSNYSVGAFDGSGTIDGFASSLIGHSTGDVYDVHIYFPDNYGDTTKAGKGVTFTMTVNSVYDLNIPDELVPSDGEADMTLEKYLLNSLQEYVEDICYVAVADCSTFAEIGEAEYQYFTTYYDDQFNYYAWYYGVTREELVEQYALYGYDISMESLKAESLETFKQSSAIFYFCKNNGIDISDATLAIALEELIESYVDQGYEDAEVRKYYTETMDQNQLKSALVENIFVDYMTETYFSTLK